jgi:hypothetical protein
MILYYFIGYFNLWDEGNPLVLPHVLLDIPQIRFFVVVVSLLHSLPLIISLPPPCLPATAAPENLMEMPNLRPHPSPIESDYIFYKTSRNFYKLEG